MFDRRSTLADVLQSAEARAILDRHLPGVLSSPMLAQLSGFRLGQLVMGPSTRDDDELLERLWADLAGVEDGAAPVVYQPAIAPNPGYEPDDVERGSATLAPVMPVPRWGVVELALEGPSHGNPFVEVELSARFRLGEHEFVAGGFYDGDGSYRVRILAEEIGVWEFETQSTARSLDGIRGTVEVVDALARLARPGAGRRPALRLRRRHAATARSAPPPTPGPTRATRSRSNARDPRPAPFNKMRMCVFPKSYLFNENEPELYPFEGSLERGLGLRPASTRSSSATWSSGSRELGELGIEADLILFHPYDRWGFADLGRRGRRPLPPLRRAPAGRLRERLVVAGERVRPHVRTRPIDDWERLRRRRAGERPARPPALDPQLPPASTTTPSRGSPTAASSGSTSTGPPRTPTHWREQWGKPS